MFRSGAMAEPFQKVVVYIIYTQIIMPKEGMKPNVPCCLKKGHSQQGWACWQTVYKTQFKGLLG